LLQKFAAETVPFGPWWEAIPSPYLSLKMRLLEMEDVINSHSWLLACILWRISWTLILECPARFSIAVFIFWLPQLIPCMPNSDFIRLLSSFTCNKCKIRRISRLHIRQLIRPQLPTKLINFWESQRPSDPNKIGPATHQNRTKSQHRCITQM